MYRSWNRIYFYGTPLREIIFPPPFFVMRDAVGRLKTVSSRASILKNSLLYMSRVLSKEDSPLSIETLLTQNRPAFQNVTNIFGPESTHLYEINIGSYATHANTKYVLNSQYRCIIRPLP